MVRRGETVARARHRDTGDLELDCSLTAWSPPLDATRLPPFVRSPRFCEGLRFRFGQGCYGVRRRQPCPRHRRSSSIRQRVPPPALLDRPWPHPPRRPRAAVVAFGCAKGSWIVRPWASVVSPHKVWVRSKTGVALSPYPSSCDRPRSSNRNVAFVAQHWLYPESTFLISSLCLYNIGSDL